MNSYYAMVLSRAKVAGQLTGSIDVSAYYFLAESKDEVRSRIASELNHSYVGGEGDEVTWQVTRIMSIDECSELVSGQEVTGFVFDVNELASDF